ncbi:hypothetical protein Patl1_03374 [Pistacia atlantica]|uniref:Uncharacterized protein n=1 Tax=Pistacia atlantica TaxID=434234 RepID=A0ACC1CCE1_9ROSI|nr:hypothetical protein Patl1_03374 [Pistacia atlantica]
MQDLNWEKLLKLQFQDGSFFSSLSSTAYAFMQTKNENCLKFLTKVVQKFNAGVPTLYPVDVYEHIWVVDRLLRLGISRYFQPEFKECMDYVYRYVTEEGIPFQRQGRIPDLDDTAMGFRLLRLHGYEVSADIFRHFEDGGEFFCFPRQSTEGVTVIFNLYRASQVLFPGEKILENAKKFSEKILREKHAANELLDKWLIAKDLPGEVSFALEVPWYARFPRVETRLYIEQYGGEDDIWIGKVLYRMLNVNTKIYLELAKLDYNNCQALHQTEWNSMQRSCLGTLNHLSSNALAAQGRDMSHHIHQAWGKWLMKWQEEGDRHEGEAELLVYTINLFAGHWFSDELLHHPQYKQLSDLTNRICSKLGNYQKQKVHDNGSNNANSDSIKTFQVESEMQELVQLVLQNSSNDIDSNVKQTFLTVAKSFYYTAYCDTQTINFHIVKVLFQKVT